MTGEKEEICLNSKGDHADYSRRKIAEWGSISLEPDEIVGFEESHSKIRVLEVFVGYSDEQIASESFNQQREADDAIFLQTLGADRSDIGHTTTSLDIGLEQRERTVFPTYRIRDYLNGKLELLSEIQRVDPSIDLLIVSVNPAIVDHNDLPRALYFGAAYSDSGIAISPGPDMELQYNYEQLYSAFLKTHEFLHALSALTEGQDKFVFQDRHINRPHSFRNFTNGHNNEFTLAPNEDELENYYPRGMSSYIERSIEQAGNGYFAETPYQCSRKKSLGRY